MVNRTKDIFDATASTFDADRSRLIPSCETFYRWTLDLIPPHTKRIIDLGAGSGLLTILVRERFPDARIHLMDFSKSMLDIARSRLGDDPRITIQEADYVEAPFPEEIDAVVSSLSIHHLDHFQKRAVFRKVYDALAPGGAFVNADQVAGPTPGLEHLYESLWLDQVREGGATEEQIDAALFRMREDRSACVENHLEWMREAGFGDADCWYKEGRFAVLAGTRKE